MYLGCDVFLVPPTTSHCTLMDGTYIFSCTCLATAGTSFLPSCVSKFKMPRLKKGRECVFGKLARRKDRAELEFSTIILKSCLLSLARSQAKSISIGMYRIEPVNRYYCNMVSYPTQSIEHRTSNIDHGIISYGTYHTCIMSCNVAKSMKRRGSICIISHLVVV